MAERNENCREVIFDSAINYQIYREIFDTEKEKNENQKE